MSVFEKIKDGIEDFIDDRRDYFIEKRIEQFKLEANEYFINKKNLNQEQLEERRLEIAEKYEEIIFGRNYMNEFLDQGHWEYIEFINDDDLKINAYFDYGNYKLNEADKALTVWDRRDGEVASFVYMGESAYDYLPKSVLEDKKRVISLGSYYPAILDYVPNHVRADKEFLKEFVIYHKISNYEYLPKELKDDKEFLIEISIEDKYFIHTLPSYILDDEFIDKMSNVGIKVDYYNLPNEHPLKKDAKYVLNFLDEKLELNKRDSNLYSSISHILGYRETYNLIKTNKDFLIGLIERGYIEAYLESSDEFKKDPKVIRLIVEKFKEFDASNDYDIDRIAQYPSKLEETLRSIDFDKERLYLGEKIDLNNNKENGKKEEIEI